MNTENDSKRPSLNSNKINHDEKINKTFHSKKSLLNSLGKIMKEKPYHKDEISLDDYHLFHHQNIPHNKFDRPKSSNIKSELEKKFDVKKDISGNRINLSEKTEQNENQNNIKIKNFLENDGKQTTSLYSNYGNFIKNHQIINNKNKINSKINNSNSINFTNTYDNAQTLNFTETEFTKQNQKKEPIINNTNLDFLAENDPENEIILDEFNTLKKVQNLDLISKNPINILNKINKVDLIIEDPSDILIEEELIDLEEIKNILNTIFMNYSKFDQISSDYFLNFQSTITVFKIVNIIHKKIIPLEKFSLMLKKDLYKSQKISFEMFLDLISRICYKLFENFLLHPEKCLFFLTKYHFEPIFSTNKLDLFLINTAKRGVLYNDKNDFLQSFSQSMKELNSKRGNLSKSLPPRLESIEKIQVYNESVKNFNNLNNLNVMNFDKVDDYNYNKPHQDFQFELQLGNTSSFSFQDIENHLKTITFDINTKIIINSITPTLLTVYKVFFPHETKRTFVKENYMKKSHDALYEFCKEFDIVPKFLSFNFISNYFNLITKENGIMEPIYLSEEYSHKSFFIIKDFENNREVYKGILFTFYKFCLFLIHISYFTFNRLEKFKISSLGKNETLKQNFESNTQKDSKGSDSLLNVTMNEKILEFFNYLTRSKGLLTVEKKLTRINSANLTFIPINQVILLVKQHKENNNKSNQNFHSIPEKLNESYESIELKEINGKPDLNLKSGKNHSSVTNLNENQIKIRNILSINISEKTLIKLEGCLDKLKEMFSFYSINYEKLFLEKMNFSCFIKFLKDANLVSIPYDVKDDNYKAKLQDNELVFNSRIFGECILPKKAELSNCIKKDSEKNKHSQYLNQQEKKQQNNNNDDNNLNNNHIQTNKMINNLNLKKNSNEKLFGKSKDFFQDNNANHSNTNLINNNSNNNGIFNNLNYSNNLTTINSQIYQEKNENSSRIEKLEKIAKFTQNHRKNSNSDDNINLNNNSHIDNFNNFNENNELNVSHDNKSKFIDDSLDLSHIQTSNINLNNNIYLNQSNIQSENNILMTNNQGLNGNKNHNMNFPPGKIKNSKILSEFNLEKKLNFKDFKYSLPEKDLNVIFTNLVGKKSYDAKKVIIKKENAEKNKIDYYKLNKNMLVNSNENASKINFNLFIKSLEIISGKIYGKILKAKNETQSHNVHHNKYENSYLDLCFEAFIDNNLPIIYDNFKKKYEDSIGPKNSDSIEEYLEIIKDENIANLLCEIQQLVKIFLIPYCDKFRFINFEKTLEMLKDFKIYPKSINLSSIKSTFAHYSNLFNIIVNTHKNGDINYLEIQKQTKTNGIEYLNEKEFKFLKNEDILNKIKKTNNEENKINLSFLTEFLGILSLKIKSNSKLSDFERTFYLFEKMGNCDETIKKILINNGKTFNSHLDYKSFLKGIKLRYSEFFNYIDLDKNIKDDFIKFNDLFQK